MSQKIASLYAEIGADTSKFEQGTKKVKSGLDQQAAAMAKFSADATRNAKSYLSYEAQKAKALAATERAAAKLAKEEERAAKAAAKAAEAQRKANLVIAPGIEGRLKGLQEFTAANAGLISVAGAAAGAIAAIGIALNKTIDQVVEYGDQVTKLKTITGQSAEATSNTIQLADDARISYEKLTVALQFASKQGIDTSITGLAKLSVQYKALAPGIERTEFLVKTFGKSGVEMGKILEMDTNAIKNFKANAGQILTEQDLANIKRYNVALDTLKDSFESATNSIGKGAMTLKTDFLNGVNVVIRATQLQIEKHLSTKEAIKQATEEISKEQAAFIANKDAAEADANGIDTLAESQKAAEETAKSLSGVFSNLLSSMSSIQKANDDYTKTTNDLAKSDEELAGKKQHLTYEWYKQVQAGKDTVEAYDKYMESLTEIQKAEQDNAAKKAQLEEDTKKAANERLVSRAQELVSVDGVSEKEFEWLENLKVSHGLVSRAAADQAIAEEQAAQSLVSGFESTLPPMEQSLQIMKEIAAYNGTRVSFGVDYFSNLPGSSSSVQSTGNTYGTNGVNYSQMFSQGQSNPMSVPMASRDSGGPGIAGTPYMIGTGAQPEIFTPSTNGTFTPANKQTGGDTYNITINNPVPVKAEDSIRRELRKMSVIGAGAKTQ